MLFNTINYAIFLPVVFLIFWYSTFKKWKIQNELLLLASYFFYSCWNWHFLFLLIFSTFLDYYIGLKMQDTHTQKEKKFWLALSIMINLGVLGLFKYFNFFSASFAQLISCFGFNVNPCTLNVILPVGISFYTFHGLSYVIDVYKNRIKAEKNLTDYAVFVSFFPLLVAGPIERATHLLPQIKKERSFNYLKTIDGLRQILWGLFKKMVIADNCAEFANQIFNQSSGTSGSMLLIGAVFFAFQIYGDFSGYSDIALGTARLFGIELLRNFAFPYFSRDIAEFWRRWHISLSSWFRDYVYIPLGGNKGSIWTRVRNVFIIFIVSGFWHGASWNFIVWGALNALLIMPSIIMKTNRHNLEIVAKGKILPSLKEMLQMATTFCLTVLAWIFFRAENIQQASIFISGIFSKSLFSFPKGTDFVETSIHPYLLMSMIVLFIWVEWLGREQNYALENIGLNWKRPVRYAMYYALIMAILKYGGAGQQFIYFQF